MIYPQSLRLLYDTSLFALRCLKHEKVSHDKTLTISYGKETEHLKNQINWQQGMTSKKGHPKW